MTGQQEFWPHLIWYFWIQLIMRTDSCRHCGETMIPCKSCEHCPICKEPMKLYCTTCDLTSETQIHQHSRKIYVWIIQFFSRLINQIKKKKFRFSQLDSLHRHVLWLFGLQVPLLYLQVVHYIDQYLLHTHQRFVQCIQMVLLL